MARGVNKVILVGTLGRDPEMKYAANGNAIANLSVATSEQWNDKATGERQEKTEWHRVVMFGRLAEVAGQYLTKGSQVYLEGKLQTRKWQDQNSGQDRYSTEVVIDINGRMEMLGGGGRQGSDASYSDGGSFGGGMNPGQPNARQQPNQQAPMGGAPNQGNGYGQSRGPAQGYGNQNQGSPMQQAPAYSPNDFDDDDVPF